MSSPDSIRASNAVDAGDCSGWSCSRCRRMTFVSSRASVITPGALVSLDCGPGPGLASSLLLVGTRGCWPGRPPEHARGVRHHRCGALNGRDLGVFVEAHLEPIPFLETERSPNLGWNGDLPLPRDASRSPYYHDEIVLRGPLDAASVGGPTPGALPKHGWRLRSSRGDVALWPPQSGVRFAVKRPTPRSLTVAREDPVPVLRQLAPPNCIGGVRAIASGTVPRPTPGALLNRSSPPAEAGRATRAFTPGEAHTNPMGTLHGAIIAPPLSARGCPARSRPAGPGFSLGGHPVASIRPRRSARNPPAS